MKKCFISDFVVQTETESGSKIFHIPDPTKTRPSGFATLTLTTLSQQGSRIPVRRICQPDPYQTL